MPLQDDDGVRGQCRGCLRAMLHERLNERRPKNGRCSRVAVCRSPVGAVRGRMGGATLQAAVQLFGVRTLRQHAWLRLGRAKLMHGVSLNKAYVCEGSLTPALPCMAPSPELAQVASHRSAAG